MNANAPILAKQIGEVINEGLKEKNIKKASLAEDFGVQYRTVAYWLSANRHIPAYIVPALCEQIGTYKPLDLLEHAVGRMAFSLPPISVGLTGADITAIQQLVKEVGEALEALAMTLADGRVENHELPVTMKELDDVIHECAKLKHWLVERNRAYNCSIK